MFTLPEPCNIFLDPGEFCNRQRYSVIQSSADVPAVLESMVFKGQGRGRKIFGYVVKEITDKYPDRTYDYFFY